MKDGLSAFQILLLAGYALGMVGGQMLFKLAALRLPAEAGVATRLASLVQNGWFVAAVLLYGVLSVFWVWVLTFTPLSRAYPFVALAFAVTPLVAALAFSEPLSLRLVLGILVIAGGLVLVAG
ncbi:hypothetical protein CCR97_23305 [Rhodoplanes elegans]|uniref:EamA domain-containing protein n=1 Tax=Rhodoplanes elegans TaxID=29408 RepID=A0A327KLE6_9BRAD|nr:hypothetical protein [Rhodoplanes elegans]MBK5961109.1 hypothetical protein [Rhodoplanes elegans]RAI39061.1 hypothetical protein CH338_10665 [Rhodoplanes elegans]